MFIIEHQRDKAQQKVGRTQSSGMRMGRYQGNPGTSGSDPIIKAGRGTATHNKQLIL